MTIDEIYKLYKTSYAFEIATGLSHTNLVNWRKAGYIPLASQRKLEKLTEGKLVARWEDLGPT